MRSFPFAMEDGKYLKPEQEAAAAAGSLDFNLWCVSRSRKHAPRPRQRCGWLQRRVRPQFRRCSRFPRR